MRTVWGVGISDVVRVRQNPIHHIWSSMLERCYSQKYHEKRPTYIGTSVDDSWHLFSTFMLWVEQQCWQGMALDKDIITPGNRVYGPDQCCFVPVAINNLLTTSASRRGSDPLGVDVFKRTGKFRARMWAGGKQRSLGHFNTPEEAHRAWQIAKINAIDSAITAHPDLPEQAIAGLMARIIAIQKDISDSRQTMSL